MSEEKNISQINGHKLVDSDLRAKLGDVDLGGSTLVSELNKKTNKDDLETFKATVNSSVSDCEAKVESAVNRVNNILGEAPENFDTFKEVSDWISEHGEEYTELSNKVNGLPTNESIEETYAKKADIPSLDGYIKTEELENLATKNELSEKVTEIEGKIPSLDGYATEAWVGEQGFASSSAIPTKVSQLTNDSGFLTEHQSLEDYYTKTETDSEITTKIAEVVNGAPEDFDTLKEMSDWISNHENSASAMNTAIQGKADKATTLAGYGIEDAYTKDEIDKKLPSEIEKEYGPFKVDGVVVEPVDGVYTLASSSKKKVKYTLSGYLKGRIKVDNSKTADGTGNTTLTLDNCYIDADGSSGVADETSAAIYYAPAYEKLILKLAPNSYNYIVCSGDKTGNFTEDSGELSNGAVWSNNGLRVSGLGYLTINTTAGGHGMKCNKFDTEGKPSIHISAYHDGIHADGDTEIKCANIHVEKANDGIQCEKNFRAYGCNFSFGNVVTKIKCASGMNNFYVGCKFAGASGSIENLPEVSGSNYGNITKGCVYAMEAAEGEDTWIENTAYDGSNGTFSVDDTAKTITINVKKSKKDKDAVLIYGDWSDYSVIMPVQQPAKLILDGAIIKSIDYTFDGKRMVLESNTVYNSSDQYCSQGKNTEDLPNVILNGIHSAKNMTIKCDQTLIVAGAPALDGSEVALKGDGVSLFLAKDEIAISGTIVYIGAEDDTDATNGNDAKKEGGDIYVNGDIYGRLTGDGSKGQISIFNNHTGDFYAERLICADSILYTAKSITSKGALIEPGTFYAQEVVNDFDILELYKKPFDYIDSFKSKVDILGALIDSTSKSSTELLKLVAKKLDIASALAYPVSKFTNDVGYQNAAQVSATAKAEVLNKVPDCPTEDGNYTLKATCANGVVSYSWEKESTTTSE